MKPRLHSLLISDTFTWLTAMGLVNGAFDSMEISRLASGFEYDLTTVDGQVVLEAQNDGVLLRGIPAIGDAMKKTFVIDSGESKWTLKPSAV